MMLQPSKRNIKALFLLLCEPLLLSDSLFLSISLAHPRIHAHTLSPSISFLHINHTLKTFDLDSTPMVEKNHKNKLWAETKKKFLAMQKDFFEKVLL